MSELNYQSAGLNLDLYEEGLQGIVPYVRRTHTKRVMDGFGGFASLFSMENNPGYAKNYKNPVMVSCADGVGTKLKIASMMNKHDTIGIDLVAMNVNDCICTGGEPLFFLDYVALPKDNPELLKLIVKGISDGCVEAECALVGGETAILPDVYKPEDYDLAGFCVGVVEKENIIDGKTITPGDVVLGLSSTGLHSNGYSLARKIAFDHAKLSVDSPIAELGKTLGEAMLEPTRIYVRAVKQTLYRYRDQGAIKGLAHITGGGLVDNLPRILPAGTQAVIQRDSWPMPAIFPWLQKTGGIAQAEMDRVFNTGIGFCMVVAAPLVDQVRQFLDSASYPTHIIGEIRKSDKQPDVVMQ